MAKFSDYVQKDEIDQEIQEAGDNAANRDADNSSEIPERFKDKSAQEIAASYLELEKAYSRQGNDLGQMRSTMDELLRLQSEQPLNQPPNEESPSELTVDEFYENPDESISRKVEQVAGERIAALEAKLQQETVNHRLAELETKYPGWQQTVATPEFANWVNESPLRQRLAAQADAWDLDAANDILELHSQFTVATGAAVREQALADGSLETGGASVPAQEQTFSRIELGKIRVLARQGDIEAQDYLKANGAAINEAYQLGNITD